MSPRNFSGSLVEFPGGVLPKNSVFEAIERRRVAAEAATKSIDHANRIKRGQRQRRIATMLQNREVFDDWICEQFSRKRKRDAAYSFKQFRIVLPFLLDAESRKKTDSTRKRFLMGLRKRLKPRGEFLSGESLRRIVKERRPNFVAR